MAPPHLTWIFTHQFNLSEMPSQTCPEVGFLGDSKLQLRWQWRLTLNRHRPWTDIKILPGFVTGFNGKITTLTSVQRKFYGVGWVGIESSLSQTCSNILSVRSWWNSVYRAQRRRNGPKILQLAIRRGFQAWKNRWCKTIHVVLGN